MKRKLLIVLAILTLCVALAACKKSEDAPASSAAPEATATPEPTLPPYEANALTGEARDADYRNQRITAVMVNNIVAARPQRGLSKADILFEIKVEGGITRFMPLYTGYEDIGEIGPVRSGRDQFFRLILPWQALYVHEGQSVVMQQYAIDYSYGNLNINDVGNWGDRDEGRVNWNGASYNSGTLDWEHTLYMTSDELAEYIQDHNIDMDRPTDSTFFNFVDYRTGETRDLSASLDSAYSDKYGPVVSDGEYIEIEHSPSYKTRFLYDAASNTYTMQQNYSDGQWRDTVDEANDTTLAFPNVLVLYTDIHTYPGHEAKDLQYAEYAWGGVGYYCYGGKCEKIYWQKGTPQEALRLYYLTEDGQCSDTPLEVNTGKSYVAVTDVDYAENFIHTTLADMDLESTTTKTYESDYVEDDAEAGETLGMSTDDLTNNATGAGDAAAEDPEAVG